MMEQLDRVAADGFLQAGVVDIDGSFPIMLGLFLVFAFLLSMLVVKPLIATQQKRFSSMDGARREAAKAELDAAEKRLTYESKLKAAREDAVGVRDAERDAAQVQADALVAEAKAEAEAKVAAAREQLEAQAVKARAELDATSDELATLVVEKLLPSGKAA